MVAWLSKKQRKEWWSQPLTKKDVEDLLLAFAYYNDKKRRKGVGRNMGAGMTSLGVIDVATAGATLFIPTAVGFGIGFVSAVWYDGEADEAREKEHLIGDELERRGHVGEKTERGIIWWLKCVGMGYIGTVAGDASQVSGLTDTVKAMWRA